MSVERSNRLRALAVRYIWEWLGVPYMWGGDDFSGFDCSGLIVEALQGVGILSRSRDLSAAALYQEFEGYPVSSIYPGVLIFFPNLGGRIIHVGMAISEENMIHAAGGGSGINTVADAVRENSFIRLDRISYFQGERYERIDPFLSVL